MDERFSRNAALVGEEGQARLARSRVLLFGLGGVGGYVLEALVRVGVGEIDVVDGDRIERSNFNRQILASEKTLGMLKTEVAAKRALSINPELKIREFPIFYLPENADSVPIAGYDYVIDCVDTVTAKLEIAVRCAAEQTRLISCMGTGNKRDPSAFVIADISKTTVCPLCRVMRRLLRERGITALKVLYSTEPPVNANPPASLSFCPSVAGLLIAAEVVGELLENK